MVHENTTLFHLKNIKLLKYMHKKVYITHTHTHTPTVGHHESICLQIDITQKQIQLEEEKKRIIKIHCSKL